MSMGNSPQELGESRGGAPASGWESREWAGAWARTGAARDQALGPATELMLDLAGVGAGACVLDVAAGTGEETLAAARRVGPAGRVLATDTSASMLEVAAEAARQAGLANVETRVMDAHDLALEPESFDAAISRLGLNVLPDPQTAAAGIRRALKPGGRLAALVSAGPEHNPLLALPREIVRRAGGLPPPEPGRPGVFGLSGPGELEGVLRAAGFRDVAVRTVTRPHRFPSTAQAVQFVRETPLLRELLPRLSETEREAAWAEIERELRRFEGPDGFEAPGEVLVGVASR